MSKTKTKPKKKESPHPKPPVPTTAAWCNTCKSTKELKAEAQELGIRYFSRLKREELAEAVWCAREKGESETARLNELMQLGKQRSEALWAAWRKKKEQAS